MTKHTHTLYKIYYSDKDGNPYLVYLGRTNAPLTTRLRQHFVKHHPFQKDIDVEGVTLIEYAELKTVADMYVAEIVLINQLKPYLNADDKARDDLTLDIDLSGLEWRVWDNVQLLEKWKSTMESRSETDKAKRRENIMKMVKARMEGVKNAGVSH